MLDYQTKLQYLEKYGESFKGTLSVTPKPERFKHLDIQVFGISYYNGEEGDSQTGRFSQEDLSEILRDSKMHTLDKLDEAKLEVDSRVCANHLWGFRFSKDAKFWITEFEPRQVRF